jgi:hypothetical protein
MRLPKIALLIILLYLPLMAQNNRNELIIKDHYLYFYYNISKIVLGYQTTPHYAELLQFEIRGFPKTLAGPLAYKMDPELYDMGIYNYWNVWDMIANSQRPYQLRFFYGEIQREKNTHYRIRGSFITFSHLLSIGKEIVPYPGLEIGFENKNIEYYSELAQDVNTKRISILFIGRDLNDQILRFTIIRKGINPEKIPAIDLPNTFYKVFFSWSFNTPYNRRAEFLLGKAYQVQRKKFNFYLTPSLGFRLYLPVTIDLDNTFIIDTYPLTLIPLFNLECYFPNKILFSD